MKSYLDYGMFTPLQVAGIAALEGPQDCVEEIRETYRERRDVLCEGLNGVGWEVAKPKATMFVWARIPLPFRELGFFGVLQDTAPGGAGGGVAGNRLR